MPATRKTSVAIRSQLLTTRKTLLMKQNKIDSKFIINSAMIAAAYIALSYISSLLSLSFGAIQFRLSEALNILAAVTPAAIPGLTIGCLLSNISSPFGIVDIIFGTVATLLSAVLINLIGKLKIKAMPVLAAIPPTVLNGLAVGIFTVFFTDGTATIITFGLTFLSVAVSELIICALLGTVVFITSKKYNLFK